MATTRQLLAAVRDAVAALGSSLITQSKDNAAVAINAPPGVVPGEDPMIGGGPHFIPLNVYGRPDADGNALGAINLVSHGSSLEESPYSEFNFINTKIDAQGALVPVDVGWGAGSLSFCVWAQGPLSAYKDNSAGIGAYVDSTGKVGTIATYMQTQHGRLELSSDGVLRLLVDGKEVWRAA